MTETLSEEMVDLDLLENKTEFTKEFNKRHDFNTSGIKYLKNKFKDIKFNNIPDAWIYPLEKFLNTRYIKNIVIEVSQENGDIKIIKASDKLYQDFYNKKASELIDDIELIDIDLYQIFKRNKK